jgi:hypothetical protein
LAETRKHEIARGSQTENSPSHSWEEIPFPNPKEPALHSLHIHAPPKLYLPEVHTAAVKLVDPSAHAYPAAQSPLHVAVVSPATDPYLPPGHAVHDPAPPTLYVPAGHMAAVGVVDPTAHA